MSYAQTAYPVPIGIPPTRYLISQTGCLLTSFCNLLARKGRAIDPPTLNAFFRDHNLYIDVDDGVRDDLAWNSISQFDANIQVSKIGSGTPVSNDAIVKFIYNGTTHFCLVNDIMSSTIIDSWDGKIKSWNAYPGGPQAWASYTLKGEAMDTVQADDVKNLFSALTGGATAPSDLIKRVAGKSAKDAFYAFVTDPVIQAYVKDLRNWKTEGVKLTQDPAAQQLAAIKKIIGA